MQATQNYIDTATQKTLSSIYTVLNEISNKLPRVTRTKEETVNFSESFGSAFTTSVVNATSNPITWVTVLRMQEPFNFSSMWANNLYNNIK